MVLKHSLKGWALLESTRVFVKRLRCNLSVKAVYSSLFVTKDGLTTWLALMLICLCNGWHIKKLPATQITWVLFFPTQKIYDKNWRA